MDVFKILEMYVICLNFKSRPAAEISSIRRLCILCSKMTIANRPLDATIFEIFQRFLDMWY